MRHGDVQRIVAADVAFAVLRRDVLMVHSAPQGAPQLAAAQNDRAHQPSARVLWAWMRFPERDQGLLYAVVGQVVASEEAPTERPQRGQMIGQDLVRS